MNRPKDIIDELTKDELVAWVRTQFFRMPKRSDILFIRWEKQSEDLMRDMQAHAKALDGIDFADRDRLVAEFNASKNAAEKLRLLEKIEPFHKAITAHQKAYQALTRRQQKVDKLYGQIDVERQKER